MDEFLNETRAISPPRLNRDRIWTDGQIVAVTLAIVLLSIFAVAALVLVLIVIAAGIIFLRRPVYYATAHIEITSKAGPDHAHPVDSLALLDQMRGPRPGGPRARRK